MRFITIASILLTTAHLAVSAPVHSIARRAQGGSGPGAAIILGPPSNGALQRRTKFLPLDFEAARNHKQEAEDAGLTPRAQGDGGAVTLIPASNGVVRR
ncbi:hypothetical protein K439DRAFT_1628367 [Ramaria rubella]|nr:hypothetical protein K439DRAFT_1628367 [Ramaria rubella]